jgi:branched-chain amino acid transport system permease protein
MTKYRDQITSYAEEMQVFRTGVRKFWFGALLVFLLVLPWVGASIGGNYVPYLLNQTGIAILVALGLNLLMGSAGLISMGHAAFLAVGAYTAGILSTKLGFPFWMTITLSGLSTGVIGMVVGLPALRLKGIYLALGTLAFQFITEHVIVHWASLTGGPNGLFVPRPALGDFQFDTDIRFYYLLMPVVVVMTLGMVNLRRTRFGRALVAIRDSDVAAEAVGINLAKYKTMAFGISAAYAGVAGAFFAHYLEYIGPDHFNILLSIEFIVMLIIGGTGSLLGAILGAIFMTLMPEGVRLLEDVLRELKPDLLFPDLRAMVIGLVFIFFIVFEPEGLAGRWRKIREYWGEWPF